MMKNWKTIMKNDRNLRWIIMGYVHFKFGILGYTKTLLLFPIPLRTSQPLSFMRTDWNINEISSLHLLWVAKSSVNTALLFISTYRPMYQKKLGEFLAFSFPINNLMKVIIYPIPGNFAITDYINVFREIENTMKKSPCKIESPLALM